MPKFADILLPIPLPKTFTYRLPDSMQEAAQVGMRVIVSFGKQHLYTGIIVNLHNIAPEGYEAKDIDSIIDNAPIIRHPQLPLWQWMADYYMCSMGDVMKAALPSGMKIESETTVTANAEYEEEADNKLSDGDREIMSIIGPKPMSINALEKLSGRKNLLPVVRRLLSMEALFINENIVRSYKPKTRHCVRVNLPQGDTEKIHKAFEIISRSQKQQSLFLKLLDMSRFLQKDTPKEVTQQDLLKLANCSTAILSELKKKGLVEVYASTMSRIDDSSLATTIQPAHELSEVQKRAYNEILKSYNNHNITLLHGVTSSGKTEIYIHLIQKVIEQKRQALFMVPEIALTTQLCIRLREVFGKRMVVYHSKLSDGERVEIWNRLLTDNTVDVVLGVRSSVLLPFRQLGLVVIDEEHEPSFKQQDPAPRYHGRDVGIVLAARHGAKVLLGSATPSIESYYLANIGKYGFVRLTERHEGLKLPNITLVSLQTARKEKSMIGPFTPMLVQQVNHTLQRGAQVILFQNRRGFAPMVECTQCSWVPRCPRCDVSLTYHKRSRSLVCHYCGYSQPLPDRCPICGNQVIEQLGYGTERIEESIGQLLPNARTCRMDTDTTQGKRSYEKLIGDFESGKNNLLIGTQMVSKGLDFGGVKTVGILNADALMNFPDFRAFERAFQLMEQVAGRAGRRASEGEVIIQCSNPQHPLLQQVVRHDYEGMVRTQLEDRRRFNYPPFTRIITIYMKGRDELSLNEQAEAFANRLRLCFGNRVLGPDAPGVARIQNFFIRKIILKIEREASTQQARSMLKQIQEDMSQQKAFARLIFYYDVDPM